MYCNNTKNNKVKGLFYGQAIGDCIGLCGEYMTKEEVEKKYHEVVLFRSCDKIDDYHRITWDIGDWTDDTDLFICIVKSIIDEKKYDSVAFAKYYLKWLNEGLTECNDTSCHGAGNTTTIWWGDSYNIKDPERTGVRMLIYDPIRPFTNASNGSLMRISILGALENEEDIINNTIKNSLCSHANPECVISCVFFVLLISKLIKITELNYTDYVNIKNDILSKCKNILKKYCDELDIMIKNEVKLAKYDVNCDSIDNVIIDNYKKYVKYDSDKIYNTLYKYSITSSLSELNLDTDISYVFKTLACALVSLEKIICTETNFHKILSEIILKGGDTDTNCAVAGALLGSYIGFNNIPNILVTDLLYFSYYDKLYDNFINLI